MILNCYFVMLRLLLCFRKNHFNCQISQYTCHKLLLYLDPKRIICEKSGYLRCSEYN